MKHIYPVLFLTLLSCVLLAGCVSEAGEATLVIAVRDSPKTTDIGTISSLNLTISEVSVHRSDVGEPVNEGEEEMMAVENGNDTSGWFVVVDKPQTVDLIQLQNVSEVIGQEALEAGNFTQIRLAIMSGTITVNDTDHDLSVPSGVLKLNRGFVLVPGETLTLTLDFNVERSIVHTGAGSFKLQPVIAVLG
ncbi:MAG: DUF4382 domain-containing protein [Methanomicrobiaceae archaeon]|nr:DUF4382 domain-containing protein [Methanomicrobiaceae archaeon]